MAILKKLEQYEDKLGNKIDYDGCISKDASINFRGSNNKISVASDVSLAKINIQFDCSDGYLELGGNSGVSPFSAYIRIGQDSKVIIGSNVSTTNSCVISAVEGTTVLVGNDVMLASENEIRADDGHPIFAVRTGKRLNPAKSIHIGSHVWIAKRAVVLGGSTIGDGSVLGFGSVLKGRVPNNCIAAGVPAKVTRRDIAWERPHLSLAKPFYKPDSSTVVKSSYWNFTDD